MKPGKLAAGAVAGLFRLWQLTFSLLLPPSCRFEPSCSQYGIEALRRHGLLGGLWLTVARLARCHPWGGSGYDPVPDHFCLAPWSHRAPAAAGKPGADEAIRTEERPA